MLIYRRARKKRINADLEKADAKSSLSIRRVELIQKIINFIKLLDEDSDTSFSHLLQTIIEHLTEQNVVDRENRENLSDIRENLKKIKSTLNRMKKQDVAKKNYANAIKRSTENRAEALSQ